MRDGEWEWDGGGVFGMNLRELVREFRWQTLVLFKCCLLQPKVFPAVSWIFYFFLKNERGFANVEVDAVLWVEV